MLYLSAILKDPSQSRPLPISSKLLILYDEAKSLIVLLFNSCVSESMFNYLGSFTVTSFVSTWSFVSNWSANRSVYLI